jgi:hypothetical protein
MESRREELKRLSTKFTQLSPHSQKDFTVQFPATTEAFQGKASYFPVKNAEGKLNFLLTRDKGYFKERS